MELKEKILDVLKDGEGYFVSDLEETLSVERRMLVDTLREMTSKGTINKEIVNGKAFYSLDQYDIGEYDLNNIKFSYDKKQVAKVTDYTFNVPDCFESIESDRRYAYTLKDPKKDLSWMFGGSIITILDTTSMELNNAKFRNGFEFGMTIALSQIQMYINTQISIFEHLIHIFGDFGYMNVGWDDNGAYSVNVMLPSKTKIHQLRIEYSNIKNNVDDVIKKTLEIIKNIKIKGGYYKLNDINDKTYLDNFDNTVYKKWKSNFNDQLEIFEQLKENGKMIIIGELVNLFHEDVDAYQKTSEEYLTRYAKYLESYASKLLVDSLDFYKHIIKNGNSSLAKSVYEDISSKLDDLQHIEFKTYDDSEVVIDLEITKHKEVKEELTKINKDNNIKVNQDDIALNKQHQQLAKMEKDVKDYIKANEERKNNNQIIKNAIDKLNDKHKSILREYLTKQRREANYISSCALSGFDDYRLTSFFEKTQNNINEYGDKCLEAIYKAVKVMGETANVELKLHKKMINLIIEIYEEIMNASVDNEQFGLTTTYEEDLRYNQTYLMVKELSNKLKYAIDDYNSHDKEIKEYEKLKEAVGYNVLVKDLTLHKRYLKAKKTIESKSSSEELNKAISDLRINLNYLDSNELVNKAKVLSRQVYYLNELPELIKSNKQKYYMLEEKISHQQAEIEFKEKDLSKLKEELKKMRVSSEVQELNEKILKAKSELDACNSEIDEIENNNQSLQRETYTLSLFAFKKKKELSLKIQTNNLKIQDLRILKGDKEKEYNEINDKCQKSEKQERELITKKENVIKDNESSIVDLRRKITLNKRQLDTIKESIKTLESELETFEKGGCNA